MSAGSKTAVKIVVGVALVYVAYRVLAAKGATAPTASSGSSIVTQIGNSITKIVNAIKGQAANGT